MPPSSPSPSSTLSGFGSREARAKDFFHAFLVSKATHNIGLVAVEPFNPNATIRYIYIQLLTVPQPRTIPICMEMKIDMDNNVCERDDAKKRNNNIYYNSRVMHVVNYD
jgi:hypothetical protein